MMAMLFAQRVILGKTEFSAVPAKLKPQVADILINECGLPELVPAEFGGTAEAAREIPDRAPSVSSSPERAALAPMTAPAIFSAFR